MEQYDGVYDVTLKYVIHHFITLADSISNTHKTFSLFTFTLATIIPDTEIRTSLRLVAWFRDKSIKLL